MMVIINGGLRRFSTHLQFQKIDTSYWIQCSMLGVIAIITLAVPDGLQIDWCRNKKALLKVCNLVNAIFLSTFA